MRVLSVCAFLTSVTLVCGSYDAAENVLFPMLPHGAPRSKNNQCREESQLYIASLNNMTLWAHKMWDASAKSSTGSLQGNSFQMGDWDECMKANSPFTTQFCLVSLRASVPKPDPPRDPFSLRYNPMENVMRRIYRHEDHSQMTRDLNHFGWCIPASCTPLDLESSLSTYIDKLEYPMKDLNVTYSVKISPDFCQTEKEIENFGIEDIVFCLLVAIFFVACIVGTVCDVRQENSYLEKKPKQSISAKICIAFSLRKNFTELPNADDSNEALKILYGLRTISIFMIIMDHRFGTFITTPIMNYDLIEREYRSISALFVFHGDLFVDTFFVLSGILVTYSLLSQFDKKVLHPAYIIFLRYIRLTPLYAFAVFYYASMFNHTGFGPMWKVVVPKESADCKANWWTNLLYISNYVNDKHMCMVHTWYLACDFHYFIIAIFLCLWIRKDRVKTLITMGVLFLLSVLIPFVITVAYLRPALLHFYPDFLLSPKTHDDFVMTYTKSHTRAAPYIIGMFTGYFYYKVKGREDFHFTKLTSHAITLVSVLLLFGGMASGAIFYSPYYEYNPYEAAVYASLHRPAWALGTVGLLICASYGHASLLKNVLSWSPWVPLSKLVYGAYLLHMSYQLRYVGNSKVSRFFDHFEVICLAVGDVAISFITALFLYLGIEAPIRKIFRVITSSPNKTNRTAPTETENNVTPNGNCTSRL